LETERRKRFCPICSSEINFSLETPTLDFCIDKEGSVDEVNNNDRPTWYNLIIYCSKNKSHKLGKFKDYKEWMTDLSDEIFSDCGNTNHWRNGFDGPGQENLDY
jgi:hypothetical protein